MLQVPHDASPAQRAAVHAYNAGCTDLAVLTLAVAIAGAESGWNHLAQGDIDIQDSKWGPSMGLWQIRSLVAETGSGGTRDSRILLDPAVNARAMWAISNQGQNWRPWSVFTNGAYKARIYEAAQAAQWAIQLAQNPQAAPQPVMDTNSQPVPQQGPNGRQRALEIARSQLGVVEAPHGSNNVSYWDWWGNRNGVVEGFEILGAWCAVFVSWAYAEAGVPLPNLQGAGPGFVFVPTGVQHAIQAGQFIPAHGDPQPGDIVFFSWSTPTWENGYPWVLEGGRWVQAGDHMGMVDVVEGDIVWCIEGNTSVNASQDNGGAVLRRPRQRSLILGYWRYPVPDGDFLSPDQYAKQRLVDEPTPEVEIMIHESVRRSVDHDGRPTWDIIYMPMDGVTLSAKAKVHSFLIIAPENPDQAADGLFKVELHRVGERDGNVVVDSELVHVPQHGTWRPMTVGGRATVIGPPERTVRFFGREIVYTP